MFQGLNPRLQRLLFNLWPCIRGSGGRVVDIAPDYTRLSVKLPLNWRTRNLVGTIFGGSMYASTDPYYMLMLMRILGPTYVVWDKGCAIRFKRPAKETLFAEFHVTPEMLAEVRAAVEKSGEATFTWTIAYRNAAGTVFAEFDKVLYVARKEVYDAKRARRAAALSSA